MSVDSAPNANFRRDRIPWWINALSGVVLLILLFQAVSALVDPSWAYGAFDNSSDANEQVILTLAGRNIVMVVVILGAMASQNAMYLAFTFVMNLVRELFDMGLVAYATKLQSFGDVAQSLSFLLFLVPYFFALKKLGRLARH